MQKNNYKALENKEKQKNIVLLILIYLFLIIAALSVLFPFYWMIVTSFKTLADYTQESVPAFIPTTLTFENYVTAWVSVSLGRYMINTVIFSLTTTAIAPNASASFASITTRGPVVVPPPTPANTGILEAVMMELVITCCGVKGYTANTASALQLRMMAISVENTRDLILLPQITMPLAAHISSGIVTMCFRKRVSIRGGFFTANRITPFCKVFQLFSN